MFYQKNLPAWERTARLVAGALMIACGLVAPGVHGTAVGYIIAATGAATLLTGFVGFCPACAMAGRKSISSK